MHAPAMSVSVLHSLRFLRFSELTNVQELEGEIEKLEKENSELKLKVGANVTESTGSSAALQELEEKNKTLQKANDELQKDFDKQLENLLKDMEAQQDELIQSAERLARTEDQLKESEKAREESIQAGSQIQKLENDIKVLEGARDELQKKCNQQKEALRDSTHNVDSLLKDLSEVEKQREKAVHDANANMKLLEGKNKAQAEKIAELEKMLGRTQVAKEDAEKRQKLGQDELARLQNESCDVNSKIVGMQATTRKLEEELVTAKEHAYVQ